MDGTGGVDGAGGVHAGVACVAEDVHVAGIAHLAGGVHASGIAHLAGGVRSSGVAHVASLFMYTSFRLFRWFYSTEALCLDRCMLVSATLI